MTGIKGQTATAPGDLSSRADKNTLWGLFAISLGIRLFFLMISDNEDGDSFARIQLSRAVVDEGRWLPTDIWLPVHFWILSIPYAFGLQSQFWARLLTAIAGAGTVPFAYGLMARIGSRHAALAGAMVLALNPLHIRFSVVTVSEVFLVFFVIVGVWGFTAWVWEGRYRYLVNGALAMNLACGNRMEAWLVVGVLLGVSLLGRQLAWNEFSTRARDRGIIFSALSGLFACGWMVFSHVWYGDALHIATLNAGRVEADMVYQGSIGWYTLAFWPAVLLATLGPCGFLVSVQGACRAAVRGPGRYLSLLFFGFVGVYYAQNFRSGMITDARYALFLQSLLILSGGQAMDAWGGPARRRRWVGLTASWLVAVWILAVLPLGVLSRKMQSISPCPRIKTEIRNTNSWLRKQPTPAVIALGPGLGRYGPWYSLLDDWYPENRIVVAKSEEDFVRVVQANESGHIIFAKETPWRAALWIDGLPDVVLRQVRSGPGFEVYRW